MPDLLVHRGPNQGQRYHLGDRTLLGREQQVCHICLSSSEADNPKKKDVVSRKHAVIVREDDQYFIMDGDGDAHPSHNGTYVNDERIYLPARRPLKHDDIIRICDHVLLFCGGDVDDRGSSSGDVAIRHDDSSVYLAQPAEKLKLLLDITTVLGRSLDLDALLPQVVETLLQIFKQADRGFLILVDPATGALQPRVFKTRRAGEDAPGHFSTRIVQESLKTVKGLLSNDPGRQFPLSDSLAGLSLRSVMCAPLWSRDGEPVGVLLVDSQNSKKMFTEEDLNLLMGIASQASIALANARFHRDALIWERHARDLALGREVVQSFLPERLPTVPGYQFFASYESALVVGGDYYDFIPLAGQQLGILVGDVSGKGVPAALVMTRFSAEARACLRTEPDLSAAIRKLNALMQPLILTGRFITLAVLQLDPAAHIVTMVNAGHPPPLVLRRADGAVEEMNPPATGGPPLGVQDECEYRACQFALEPGDRVVLFSDGVTEAMDADNRQLGTHGLRALLNRPHATPRELGEHVLEAVKRHTAGCDPHDDTTLVCFGRPGA